MTEWRWQNEYDQNLWTWPKSRQLRMWMRWTWPKKHNMLTKKIHMYTTKWTFVVVIFGLVHTCKVPRFRSYSTSGFGHPHSVKLTSLLKIQSFNYLKKFQRLRLLRLNYKGRPMDDTVIDFFQLISANLTTLHLFEVRDLTLVSLGLVPSAETRAP